MRKGRAGLIRVVTVALALALAVVPAACAPSSPGVVRPSGIAYAPSRGGGPAVGTRGPLERSVRRDLAEAERFLEGQIAAGHLSPESIDEVRGREPAVIAAARRAEADGITTPQERAQVDQMVRDAVERAEQRLSMPRAWGGGPAYWR